MDTTLSWPHHVNLGNGDWADITSVPQTDEFLRVDGERERGVYSNEDEE